MCLIYLAHRVDPFYRLVVAAITNYRDPARQRADAASRGHLVSGFLGGAEPAVDYLARIAGDGERCNGFSLLVHDGITHVLFEPMDFIVRLGARVPRPRTHLVRCHGLFAPNARHRPAVQRVPMDLASVRNARLRQCCL